MSTTTPAGAQPAPARRRLRGLLRVAAPTVAAFSSVLAFAAFTDDAQNNGNEATASSVTITEDVPATSPLFSLKDWRPYAPFQGEYNQTRCIGITNRGSVSVPLKLRLAQVPTGTLGDYVDVMVWRGQRDPSIDDTSCATFKADPDIPTTAVDEKTVFHGELDELPTSVGSALRDGGDPLAPGAERAYFIKWTLQDDEEAEGRSISNVDFRWESTSGVG